MSTTEKFESWKVAKLRKFVKDHLVESGAKYRRDDLIKLCNLIGEFQIEPQPSNQERQANKDNRLQEILTVSPQTILPNPDDHSSGITWSASHTDYPELNLLQIYDYLIWSQNPFYTGKKLRAYKSLSVYQNAAEGFVDLIFVSQGLPEDWVFIKGKVYASQTANKTYDAWVLMKSKGDIRACRCVCPAGLGESCTHVATLLFYVLLVNENGQNQSTPTGIKCAWLPPGKKDATPTFLSDCVDKKVDSESMDWVSIPESLDDRKALFEDVAPESRLVAARTPKPVPVPGEHRLLEPVAEEMGALPPTIDELAMVFIGGYEEEGLAFEEMDVSPFFTMVKNSGTEETCKELEMRTRDQSDSEQWAIYRWGLLTASKAHDVRTYMGRGGGWHKSPRRFPLSALKKICPPPNAPNLYQTVKAIKYGIDNEQTAADAYLALYGRVHSNKLQLIKMGLVTTPGRGHLGASVDRLAVCDCQSPFCKKKWIIEIKCPWTLRDLPPGSDEALALFKRVLASETEDCYTLDEQCDYYTQMQMQMALLGIPHAELWVWSAKVFDEPLVPVYVPFNETFWLNFEAKLDAFYKHWAVPYILSNVGKQ